jgi:hypothetical protein
MAIIPERDKHLRMMDVEHLFKPSTTRIAIRKTVRPASDPRSGCEGDACLAFDGVNHGAVKMKWVIARPDPGHLTPVTAGRRPCRAIYACPQQRESWQAGARQTVCRSARPTSALFPKLASRLAELSEARGLLNVKRELSSRTQAATSKAVSGNSLLRYKSAIGKHRS